MTDKVTEKSTKATILEAYKKSQAELRKLENQKAATSKDIPIKSNTVELAQSYSITAAVDDIAKIKGKVNVALSGIESDVLEKIEHLKLVSDQIEDAERQLKTVHGIVREADSLASLQYANRCEIDEQKKKMQAEKDAFWTEMAKVKKEWGREKDEYEYELKRKKDRDANEREEVLAAHLRDLSRKKEDYQREKEIFISDLEVREAAVEKIELELSELKAERKADIESAKESTRKEVEAELKHEYLTQIELLKQKVESLTEIISEGKAENYRLAQAVQESNERASVVAQEAVKSSKVLHISEAKQA